MFYDELKGFDHQLYSLLLEQAEFFLIDRLRDWILEKRYDQAVKIVRSLKLSESTRWIDVDSSEADRGLHKFDNREYTGDTKVEHFVYSTNRKFRACEETSCDRHGEPKSYCTEICSKIPQDGQDYVGRDVVDLAEICTKTVFDHRICREIARNLMHQVILEALERVQYIGMIDKCGITPYFLAQLCFVKGHIMMYLNARVLILVN